MKGNEKEQRDRESVKKENLKQTARAKSVLDARRRVLVACGSRRNSGKPNNKGVN